MALRNGLAAALLMVCVGHASAFQAGPSGAFVAAARLHRLPLTSVQRRLPPHPRVLRSGPVALAMQKEEAPPLERFIGCLPYALPLSDAFEWGHFLFDKFPLLAVPFVPLFPIISLLQAPFVSFGIFLALFSFVTRNPSFSRFIRFNTLQVRAACAHQQKKQEESDPAGPRCTS
jgi:hypothetical protein